MTDNQQVLRELVATLVRLAEQLAAGTGAVPLVNEQPPPEMCVSCNDLRCVLRWKSFAEAPVEDVDVRAFLLGHGLIRGYSCDLHGDSRMIDRGEYWECIHLVTPTQQCRRRQSKLWPLLDRNSKVAVKDLFRFWLHVASNDALSSIARIVGVHRNTCLRLFDLLGSACLRATVLPGSELMEYAPSRLCCWLSKVITQPLFRIR